MSTRGGNTSLTRACQSFSRAIRGPSMARRPVMCSIGSTLYWTYRWFGCVACVHSKGCPVPSFCGSDRTARDDRREMGWYGASESDRACIAAYLWSVYALRLVCSKRAYAASWRACPCVTCPGRARVGESDRRGCVWNRRAEIKNRTNWTPRRYRAPPYNIIPIGPRYGPAKLYRID